MSTGEKIKISPTIIPADLIFANIECSLNIFGESTIYKKAPINDDVVNTPINKLTCIFWLSNPSNIVYICGHLKM